MSSTHRRTPRRSIAFVLLVLLVMSLSACAKGPLLTQSNAPNPVTPCVRDSLSGMWSCMRVKRLVWFEGSRHRTNAWLGPRTRR